MNLEKEFLPYEQALALKELGFDEWCYKVYEKNSRLCNTYESTRWQNENPELVIGAPLYQQAFRWFREKYNLLGIVGYCDDNSGKFMSVIDKINSDIDYDMNAKDTYEQAELACLIKLIEIVKEK
jgi:hypothetical protein